MNLGAGLGRFGAAHITSFVIGACIAHRVPVVPSVSVLATTAIVALLLFRPRRTRLMAALLLGAIHALFGAHQALDDRLPLADQGRDITVIGTVVGLPQSMPESQRFDLDVSHWQASGARLHWTHERPRIRVSWFGHQAPITTRSVFRGTVRLRVPYAFVNPGGFDAERHALSQGINATAYVRDGILEAPSGTTLDGIRQRLSGWILNSVDDPSIGALLAALAVGDQQAIADPDWTRLRLTGTTHLMAISGLHIGLVAAAFAWLSGLVYRVRPTLALFVIRPEWMAVAGLLGAVGYACLASFSLPVMRTVLMIAVVVAGTLARKSVGTLQLLALTAFVAVLVDPLAALSPGFWLSFVGVFGLVLALPRGNADPAWRTMLRAQWVASIVLLPVGIAWFDQASLIGPFANLIAIPVITLLVVPLLLAALATSATPIGIWFLKGAALAFDGLWWVLGQCASLPLASIDLPEPTLPIVLLAMCGALFTLLPRGVPGKAFGIVCLIPLLLPNHTPLAEGQAIVNVIDVGQGLSVLVRTRDHRLLFDTGARTRGGFDLGEVAVLPALRSLRIDDLDVLVTSHLDADHAGGRAAVLRAFPGARERVGIDADPAPRCRAGERWTWNGVEFRFLHPTEHFPDLGNDSSCVLLIDAQGERVLIPGDIGADIESRLQREPAIRDLDFLIVAHHGSKHSSSAPFLAHTTPAWAIATTGFGNPFGHPAEDVRRRLGDVGTPLLDTATHGMIELVLGDGPSQEPVTWRSTERRWWRHESKRRDR